LTDLKEQHAAQRLDGMRRFVHLLAEREELRAGVSPDRAADLLSTICAQADYDSLVTTRGWTGEEYCDWLGETLISALLPNECRRGDEAGRWVSARAAGVPVREKAASGRTPVSAPPRRVEVEHDSVWHIRFQRARCRRRDSRRVMAEVDWTQRHRWSRVPGGLE
jgi:hypothetical protein